MTTGRRIATIAAAAALAPLALVALPGTASAHGYVDTPPSRQAQCAQGVVLCGDIKYEPQSVEGPKGLRSCSGGNARFAELDDDSKGWRATPVGTTVTFTWQLTARHRTSTWEYYVGDTRVGLVDDGGAQPGATVTHDVDLSGFTGRQKVLAVWNIADTANAFYACLDLQVG
ncbi:lytic polysaccharide monooxygenase auxiliary activity family 9 protein [Amycolatopsis thermophila]|uniref:Chitin-binding protein n=1 Tax=Amycolatopsis thermophila TaxID=206084 RepID=A0ABU0EZD2_9PSEU|nr:lytic polysaccharide monooxygenase auxiliary activity family 9 protein [Amycolatopsis thermophila]MDQ0380674.1 chitin-binding protein [Amycolatopsis thermophila]